MSELTQEQRARLAELADKEILLYSKDTAPFTTLIGKTFVGEDLWEPDKDIAQAMEVLESYTFFSINKLSSLSKSWYDVEVNGVHVDDMNLPMAICQAILKAKKE